MNVYDHISANTRKTVLLLCAFPVALFFTLYLFILLAVKTMVTWFVGRQLIVRSRAFDAIWRIDLESVRSAVMETALHVTLEIYPWILLTAFIWIVISYYKGGDMILSMADASPVSFRDRKREPHNTRNEANYELLSLVENTAIMAGLPTPELYVIEDKSLNAFAAGRSPKTASITLTRGLVKKLNKNELQAVIAHELAHIGNRDTRLMVIVIAGIGCFLFLGEVLIRMVGRSRGGRNHLALIILIMAFACKTFGYVIAPVLRLALSRRMEYQADATAAKITRDPDALVRALAKIADNPRVETLDSSPLVGNMCIANPAKPGFFRKLYCTHPPIEDRVAALKNMMGRDDGSRDKARELLGEM